MAVALAALAAGVLAATAADGLDAQGRARLVRYVGILVAAGLAVGSAHLLFPDPGVRRLQLSNPDPGQLMRRQLGRWGAVVAVLSVPAVVIGAPVSPLLVAEGVLSIAALGLFAWARTSTLGLRVRAWERGEAGGGYRRFVQRAPIFRFQVPDELVPGFSLTAQIFLAGSVLSVAGRAIGDGLGTLVAPGVLLAASLGLALRARAAFDRVFWTSNGVWSDAFAQSAGPVEGREPIAHDAVYWAPPRLRARVRAGLVSLDRRFPLGRVAGLGLAIIAGVHLAGAQAGTRAAALALYVVVVNGAVALTATSAVLPDALTRRLGGAVGWAAARALMNVRWLPPLALTLAGLVWLTDLVSWADVAVWSLVDLAAAAVSAGLVTLAAQLRSRRTYA